ncbi:MAG: alpha/beta hydrolase [Alphaproteobacteria bacterium]|nr:alpha/beta hydrolase [Alphaproteobacteria bacterium]
MAPDFLLDGPAKGKIVALAHGAGAPMDSPFMGAFAQGLAAEGWRVARFEFPYMAARRAGKKPGPDRPDVLVATWNAALAALGGGPKVAIGGKSMGGRIASMVADSAGARGLVCLGYPFHAPGRSAAARIAHLEGLKTRALIVQGTRDTMGTRDEVATYPLSSAIALHWIEDGDHSLVPRKSSGRTEAEAWAEAIAAVARFLAALR